MKRPGIGQPPANSAEPDPGTPIPSLTPMAFLGIWPRNHTENTDSICVYSVFFRVLPRLYIKDDSR